MPAEEPLFRQRLAMVLRRIEHHLDHALDVTVGRHEAADVQPETPGDMGPIAAVQP